MNQLDLLERNFSELYSLHEKLREEYNLSEGKFKKAFYEANIGMAIVDLDGTFLEVNSVFEKTIGYSKKELVKMTFQEITHPDDLQEDLDLYQKCLDGIINHYKLEKRYIHRHQYVINVIISVSILRSPLNSPVYFIVQIENITQLKNKYIELEKEIDLFKNLIEKSGDIFFIYCINSKIPIYISESFKNYLDINTKDIKKDDFKWMNSVLVDLRNEFERGIKLGFIKINYSFLDKDNKIRSALIYGELDYPKTYIYGIIKILEGNK